MRSIESNIPLAIVLYYLFLEYSNYVGNQILIFIYRTRATKTKISLKIQLNIYNKQFPIYYTSIHNQY